MKTKYFIIISVLIQLASIHAAFQSRCGLRNPFGLDFRNGTGHINEAHFGEFPWTAAIMTNLRVQKEVYKLYGCGAAVIAPNAVLTTAHCVKDLKDFVVRAGEWDTAGAYELLPHQDREVKKVIVHKEYVKNIPQHDIALVILQTPFKFDNHIQAISWPARETDFDKYNCFVTSWGTIDAVSVVNTIMKKLPANVVPIYECKKAGILQGNQLSEDQLCAGNQNSHFCRSDSGGPLACPVRGVRNRYYLVGFLAFGQQCSKNYVPAVFTSVVYYRKWIESNLVNYGINSEGCKSGNSTSRPVGSAFRRF